MKLRIDKEMIISILEKYYKEQLDIDGKVSINPKKELHGFGLCETEQCVLDITLLSKIKLLGKEIVSKISISEEEVMNAMKYVLEEEGYIFKSMTIDKGIDRVSVGYYTDEHTEMRAYFKGIDVEINSKTKKLGGMKNG